MGGYSGKTSNTLNWNADQTAMQNAFNPFGIYGVSCVVTYLTVAGDDTLDTNLIGGYKYVCTFT